MTGDYVVILGDTGGVLMKKYKYTDDRAGRTRHAYDICGGTDEYWPQNEDALSKAVEWYENRPINGLWSGDRLRNCLWKFRLGAPSSDATLDRAAAILREHPR